MERNLIELPSILFFAFIKKLGIKTDELSDFIYYPQEERNRYICKYALLSPYRKDQPVLVLQDIQKINPLGSKLLLLTKFPILNGEFETNYLPIHSVVKIIQKSIPEEFWTNVLEVQFAQKIPTKIGSLLSLYSLEIQTLANEVLTKNEWIIYENKIKPKEKNYVN